MKRPMQNKQKGLTLHLQENKSKDIGERRETLKILKQNQAGPSKITKANSTSKSLGNVLVVIYKAFCLDVTQGHMNGAHNKMGNVLI